MSHFVLRRIGRFNHRHGHVPRELAESLKAAPVRIFTSQSLQAMKQACSESGDSQRLQTLETYERRLNQAKYRY